MGLVGLGVMGFALTAAREREWRALAVTLGLGSVVVAAPLILLLVDVPGRDVALPALLGAGALAALVVLLPIGRADPIRVVGDQPRVDERDALFHRFYRLQPGMPEYDTYYAEHPDQKTLDERIRRMPALGTPGTPNYHPSTAPFQAAIFELIEDMACQPDRDPVPLQDPPPDLAPGELTTRLKGLARHLGAAEVGATAVNPAYVYSTPREVDTTPGARPSCRITATRWCSPWR